jgi:hypothetical protein
MAQGKKTGGRGKGTPNKATADARAAIALFVDGNAHRLQGWLDSIADGLRDEPDKEGNPGKWIVEPNPQKAFELFQSVIEYHVPKLARMEGDVNVKAKGDINVNVRFHDPNGR